MLWIREGESAALGPLMSHCQLKRNWRKWQPPCTQPQRSDKLPVRETLKNKNNVLDALHLSHEMRLWWRMGGGGCSWNDPHLILCRGSGDDSGPGRLSRRLSRLSGRHQNRDPPRPPAQPERPPAPPPDRPVQQGVCPHWHSVDLQCYNWVTKYMCLWIILKGEFKPKMVSCSTSWQWKVRSGAGASQRNSVAASSISILC